MSDTESSGRAQAAPTPWGPQTVPEIPCSNCGTGHHPDAANSEYLGQCRECGAFLRRPTDREMRQFTAFIVWNGYWLDVENGRSLHTADDRPGGDA